MRLVYFILIFLPIILIGQRNNIDLNDQEMTVLTCGYNNEESLEKDIDIDKVKIDIDIVINIINKFKGFNTNDITKIFPNFFDTTYHYFNKTYDYGYNIKMTKYEFNGGYGTYIVSLLYFDKYVLKIRVNFEIEKEILIKYLIPEFEFNLNCYNGRICYEESFLENINLYKRTYGNFFLEKKDKNVRWDIAIYYFMDFFDGGEFEKPYYILNGLGTETFDHLRYFIVSSDYEALENLIFSPSPTTRQFAALTFRYLLKNSKYKPNKIVKNRLKEILLNLKIIESGIISCRMNRWNYDEYDLDKNFEEYIITQ